MAYQLTIACLANSRKRPPPGRCVAGRLTLSLGLGDWVRPVSDRTTEEVSEAERTCADGAETQVLDVVRIAMQRAQPVGCQQENHVLDTASRWERVGRIGWSDLQGAVEDTGPSLWPVGYSSYHGINYRVPEETALSLPRSLYLVRPEKLKISVVNEGGEFGNPRRRVRAGFSLNGRPYGLIVTDPVAENKYFSGDARQYDLAEAILCVSLTAPYEGFAYKLVATVITPNRSGSEP